MKYNPNVVFLFKIYNMASNDIQENLTLIKAISDAVMLISSNKDLPQGRASETINTLLNFSNNTLVPAVELVTKNLDEKNKEKALY